MSKSKRENVFTENAQGYVIKFQEYVNRIEYESNWNHKHNYWEFFLVTEGETYHYFNGNQSVIQKGDLILIKPDDYHHIEFIEPKPYQHLDLYVMPHVFQVMCDLIDSNLYSFLLKQNDFMVIHLSEADALRLQEMINEIYMCQSSMQADSLIHTYYYPCLSKMISLVAQRFFFNSDSDENMFFYSFLAKINTPQYISCSVEEIVALSNYSHRNLSRLFKKNTNKTIKEYLTTAKINYSIELLRNKDLSILTISEMIGYNSLSHYITTFKKHTGFSPQKYRSELIDGKFLK